MAIGTHAEWPILADQAVRGRLDINFFRSGRQVFVAPDLHQEIKTAVMNESLGAEYLIRPSWPDRRWTAGVGLYVIRWTVESTNLLQSAGGTFAPSGTSVWTRQGLGVLGACRLSRFTDVEFRIVSSHYGQENQPARVASLNLLWHF